MARRSKLTTVVLTSVMQLEDRLQPGSLFFDLPDMAPRQALESPRDEMVRPVDWSSVSLMPLLELSEPVTERSVEIRVTQRQNETAKTIPADMEDESARTSRLPAAVRAAGQVESKTHALVDAKVFSPVARPSVQTPPPPNVSMSRPTTPNMAAMKKTAVQDSPAPGIVMPSAEYTAPFNPANYVKSECEDVGVKANLFNTYDGTPNDDQNFAVAAGVGANIGESYAVGYKGPDGTVSHFGPGGNCLGSFLISTGSGTWVKDVAVGVNGVYITGHQPGGISSFIIRLTPALAFVNGVTFFAPPGGSVYLNSIAVGTPVAPNVFATGSWFDPTSATPFDITKVIMYNAAVTVPTYNVNLFFPSGPSVGLSIATDRVFIAYIGGRASVTGSPPNMPHTFSLFPTPAIAWSFITANTTSISDPQNGFHGISFMGSNLGIGIYVAGSMADSAANAGGEQNLLLYKRNVAGGIVYGNMYSLPGTEYAAKANVVNRVGEHFIAGYIGPFISHNAMMLRWDFTGTVILDQTFLGGAGTEDRGFGIALRTPQPGDDAVMAGMTDTPTASMLPPPTACDPTHNGLFDGFVAKWSQPF